MASPSPTRVITLPPTDVNDCGCGSLNQLAFGDRGVALGSSADMTTKTEDDEWQARPAQEPNEKSEPSEPPSRPEPGEPDVLEAPSEDSPGAGEPDPW
jgi:hypothetical protein